jgi:hypothetical protein
MPRFIQFPPVSSVKCCSLCVVTLVHITWCCIEHAHNMYECALLGAGWPMMQVRICMKIICEVIIWMNSRSQVWVLINQNVDNIDNKDSNSDWVVMVCSRPASNTVDCRLIESGLSASQITAELSEPPQLMTVIAYNDSIVGHYICSNSMSQWHFTIFSRLYIFSPCRNLQFYYFLGFLSTYYHQTRVVSFCWKYMS